MRRTGFSLLAAFQMSQQRSDQNVAAEKSEVLFNNRKVLASQWSQKKAFSSCINKNKMREKETNLDSHEFEDVFLSFVKQIWGIPSRWRREDFVRFWLLLWVQIDPRRDFIYSNPLLPLLLWHRLWLCKNVKKKEPLNLHSKLTSAWAWGKLTRLKAKLRFPSSVPRNNLPLSDPTSDLTFFCMPAKNEGIFLNLSVDVFLTNKTSAWNVHKTAANALRNLNSWYLTI